jgi:hypothetical protein
MLLPDYDCHLLYRHCPQGLLEQLQDTYASVTALAGVSEAEEVDALIKCARSRTSDSTAAPIVVLDGYHFDGRYHHQLGMKAFSFA